MSLLREIARINLLREMFNEERFDWPLTEEARVEIRNKFESELSPENLHQDGQRSRSEAAQVKRYFTALLKELELTT